MGWFEVQVCYTAYLYSLWYGWGLLWPSVWPAGNTTWSAVSTGSVNPPSPPPSYPPTPLYAALMILQAVFKTSLKTSQSNQ